MPRGERASFTPEAEAHGPMGPAIEGDGEKELLSKETKKLEHYLLTCPEREIRLLTEYINTYNKTDNLFDQMRKASGDEKNRLKAQWSAAKKELTIDDDQLPPELRSLLKDIPNFGRREAMNGIRYLISDVERVKSTKPTMEEAFTGAELGHVVSQFEAEPSVQDQIAQIRREIAEGEPGYSAAVDKAQAKILRRELGEIDAQAEADRQAKLQQKLRDMEAEVAAMPDYAKADAEQAQILRKELSRLNRLKRNASGTAQKPVGMTVTADKQIPEESPARRPEAHPATPQKPATRVGVRPQIGRKTSRLARLAAGLGALFTFGKAEKAFEPQQASATRTTIEDTQKEESPEYTVDADDLGTPQAEEPKEEGLTFDAMDVSKAGKRKTAGTRRAAAPRQAERGAYEEGATKELPGDAFEALERIKARARKMQEEGFKSPNESTRAERHRVLGEEELDREE